MNGASLSSALHLMKSLGTAVDNSKGTLKGKSSNGSALFDETLGKALLNKGDMSQKGPEGLKKILSMLVNLLGNSSMKPSSKTIDPKDVKEAIMLLEQATNLIKKKKNADQSHQANEILQWLQSAIHQFHELLPQKQVKEKTKSELKVVQNLAKQARIVIQKMSANESNPLSNQQKTHVDKGFVFLRPQHQVDHQDPVNKKRQSKLETVVLQPSQPKAKSSDKTLNLQLAAKQNQKDPIASTIEKLVNEEDKNQSHSNAFQSGPMTKLQQYVLHVKETNGLPNRQQFAKDFEQLLSKGTFTNVGGKQQLTLQLHPQNLGSLNIQLTKVNGQLTATLITTSSEAKNLVQSSLHQLQGAFANQNLNVQKLQVVNSSGQHDAQQNSQDYQDSEGQQKQNQEQSYQQESNQNEDEEAEFSNWLEQMHLQSG